ncbi:hypothetical protein SLE2022_015670 [Rubroshorea leprosula]
MVELQSCASLVNASALCAIEKEVKGDSVNVIAEIAAELQREREKNAELMERISLLEAQIQERNKESLQANQQSSCLDGTERSFKKFKRHKIDASSHKIEDGNMIRTDMASKTRNDGECMPTIDGGLDDRLVNWMSMDDTQFLLFDKFKEAEFAADCDDTDESNDEDDLFEEDDTKTDLKDRTNEENITSVDEVKEQLHAGGLNQKNHMIALESFSVDQVEQTCADQTSHIRKDDRENNSVLLDTNSAYNKRDLKKHEKKETRRTGEYKEPADILTSGQEVDHIVSGSIALNKKPSKVPFCPKEVKKILEADVLLLKNAQSHTIRKIIVFASLGIRHGCEDMYELDFNHFSILRKGEPYVSPKDPGEHVLYENPGVRRKVFFPNKQNPTLCPVQILEEEKAMRPSDPCCPSCLFLCIKYGGRTRNLPQNEYVRQRMGRNKLKSFGPVMCRMAMLVHVRSGSFFFKALGITLLFMAGFPDDLVQKETKYRNLDLLQKYYRTDDDAEGEELFLSHPVECNTRVSPGCSQQLTGKITSTKSRGRKQRKSQNSQRSSVQDYAPSSSTQATPFGLMGYTAIQTRAMAAFQSTPSQIPADTLQTSNLTVKNPSTNVPYQVQTPYHMFPPQPANTFMPMIYWPAPTAFPPSPYPTTYGYQSYPPTANCISIHPQPHYNHPLGASSIHLTPKIVGGGKGDVVLEEADSDSDSSSSSSAEPK